MWRVDHIRVYQCCVMPVLWTVEIWYLLFDTFKFARVLGSSLTSAQVEALHAPMAEIWGPEDGPAPQMFA